jgi:molecular chaperone IbpA
MEVASATFTNGLLSIELLRELPEAMKPRTIPISGPHKVIEGKTGKAA